ncbi:hypothetical protein OAO07_00450 [Flavobacteriaceae bacterium]|jgi:hypothetical protein|nr:hypothetical protein [Flavobacteriaceae bacterium]MDA9067582.1 hypothetical protein [Flavobacteriaceae bacterium]MDB4134805.1 hypothetical protein [Flavobacteriaceae bacterium]MDC0552086.1 hypothetical protein [Flavobacteriaceae bacterium]MDC1321185.1 hypothetical protein [Flavobacteriaceae bacterium]
MRYKLFLLLFIYTYYTSYSQQDTSVKTLIIKSLEDNEIPINIFPVKVPLVRGLTNKLVVPFFNYNLNNALKKPDLDITKKTDLVTPTWDIKQTFKEGNSTSTKFRKDYYLGELETDSKYVIIKCRDHEYVDGDRIKLLLNNIVIHPNITLTGSYYTIDIDLIEGYNNIEFVALNEGESSPNTAQLSVFDENGVNLSNNKWLITTGYKARLVVFKK